tara:strand:- start:88 stop:618 length:531 start_codon:yes stop_codon:yes gene_type:complete
MNKTAAIAIINSLTSPQYHIPENYNFDHVSTASDIAMGKAISDMKPIVFEASTILIHELDKVPASAEPSQEPTPEPAPEKDAEKPGGGDMPEGMQDAIDKVNSLEHVTCERCGRWLWAEVSKPSDILSAAMKKIGFKFAKKKEKWFWKPAGDKGKRYRGRASMPSIRSRYGSEEVA